MNERDRRILQAARSSNWLATFARKNAQLIGVEPYIYSASAAIAGTIGAVGQGIITIQSDSDFAILEMSGTVLDGSNAFVLNPSITAQVTDTGSGKTFFNTDTLFNLVYGLAGFPYYLATPRILAPNTQINTNFTNLVATAYTAYVSYTGVRLYYAGGAN